MSRQVQIAAFLKERYEKEGRYFRVYDDYTPNLKKTRLTSKFYSKYENTICGDADPELIERIKKVRYDTPREKYEWPITENQCYGWFSGPLVETDRTDPRFYHPQKCTDFIKHELRLKEDESSFPKVKFTGIPFKLQ